MIYTAADMRRLSKVPELLEWEMTIPKLMDKIRAETMVTPLGVRDYIIVGQYHDLRDNVHLMRFSPKWNTSLFSNWKYPRFYKLTDEQKKIFGTLEELGYKLDFVKCGVGGCSIDMEYELSLRISWSE